MSGNLTLETVELDQLIEPDRPICYGVLKPGPFVEGGVPLVRILDIEGDELSTDGLFRVSAALDKEFARSRLEGGELLLSIQGTVGRVAVFPRDFGPANISRTIARLAFTDTSNAPFLRHWFRSQQGQRAIDGAIVGTTRSSLNIGVLRRLSVPHFTGTEKGCISEVLDTLDTAIHETEAIIAKLKAVKQGLLHDLLTRGIDANGELRPPQAEAPHLYKPSSLGWIPKAWDVGSIETMTEVLDSQRVPVNEGERSRRPGDVPYYGANGQQGWIDRPLFNEPLILLAEDGGNFDDFASRPIAYRIDGPSWVNNHAHILRARGTCAQDFIFFALVHRDIRKYISGGTRTKLTAKELKSIELPFPPMSEQKEIAQRLQSIEAQLQHESQSREKLVCEKIGLMDDLLTGRVRITPLLDEAESESECA